MIIGKMRSEKVECLCLGIYWNTELRHTVPEDMNTTKKIPCIIEDIGIVNRAGRNGTELKIRTKRR